MNLESYLSGNKSEVGPRTIKKEYTVIEPGAKKPRNKMVDIDDNLYHKIEQEPKLQFIIYQLAGLIIPTASVLKLKSNFFSKDIGEKPSTLNDQEFRASLIFRFLVRHLFYDSDHIIFHTSGQGFNFKSGKFFDFGQSEILMNHFPENSQNTANTMTDGLTRIEYEFERSFKKAPEKVPEEIKYLVDKFIEHIKDKEGLQFIKSVYRKANFNPKDKSYVPAEELQSKLITRAEVINTILNSR